MKNGKQIVVTCLAIGVFSLALSLPFISMKREKSSAYTTSSLPTTINLNDTSEIDIRNYYSSLNSLSTSERQGTNLLKNLKTILKNGQKYYAYDSGNSIWQIYEIADRDWVKSPASSTTYGTYDSSTNTITNYSYGKSSSDSKNNPYLHALYFNRNVENQVTAWDNHQQNQWGINREHVWPKSQGFDNDEGKGGARGDPMHLMAGNGYANNIHSNYFYGYVSNITTNCGSTYSNLSGNLLGRSKTLNTGTVFEPQDCDKGDIARAIFYMVARYNYLSGSDSDGIDADNPNLTLINEVSGYPLSSYTSSDTTPGKLGILTDLLAWHHADPVDEFEIHRNNLLYTNYTNNRNPFIDFPEWVDYIWGTAVYNGSTYQSYNSTPTGYADPYNDTVNGYGTGTDPRVNYVTISPNSLIVNIIKTPSTTLTANVSASNGASTGVTWSSLNSDVATVSDSGVVTFLKTGTATIRATSMFDNTKYGECVIIINNYTSVSVGTSILDYATENSWSNGTKYTSIALDDIATASVSKGGGNTGKYYTAGNEWRFYQTESAAITISVPSGYLLDNVNLSYAVANTGTLVDSSSNEIVSGNDNEINASSVTYYVSNSSSATNGQVKFTDIYVTYHEIYQEPTSITATANKTFYVGDTITKSDITLKDNNNHIINNYTFDEYQFTYEDASSGGALTNKAFNISYSGLNTTLTTQVQRKAYVSPDDISNTYNGSDFSSIGSSYGTGRSKTIDGITYAINGYVYNSTYLSFSSNKTTAPGSLINSTPYPQGITNVTVTGATPDIQLSIDGSNWVDLSSATPNTVNYFYLKMFYKNTSQSNYVNISQFVVELKGESPLNVANYIMYEDTNNQCNTKLDYAILYFGNMSTSGRNTFMTSDDYVIAQARTRLEAWLTNQGKSITHINGDYLVNNANHIQLLSLIETDNNALIIVCITISLTTLLSFIYFGSKKFKRIYK